MADQLRVVIGDDNPAMLEAVKNILQKDFDVVAALEDARAVVPTVLELSPEIVVLDISMGGLNGFEITRQLKSDRCRSKIIFLTVHEEPEFVRAGFDAGASGYVFKSRMNTDLRRAIRIVESDKVFIPEAPFLQTGPDSKF